VGEGSRDDVGINEEPRMNKDEVRILKRAGELDPQGRMYSPRALAEATKGAVVQPEPGKHGMITRLRFVGGEVRATIHFPAGVRPEEIGVELKGEILRSKIVSESGKAAESYQLVEEFRIDGIMLVSRAEAEKREGGLGPGNLGGRGPLYPPHKKLTSPEGSGESPGAGTAEGAKGESGEGMAGAEVENQGVGVGGGNEEAQSAEGGE
jgi:hypothetical protein